MHNDLHTLLVVSVIVIYIVIYELKIIKNYLEQFYTNEIFIILIY